MKALQLWKHPINNNLYIKSLKIHLRQLLAKSEIDRKILLKGVKMIDSIFTGECADAELSEIRDQLQKKAEKFK